MDKQIKNLKVFGYGLAIILYFIGMRLGLKEGWMYFRMILVCISFPLALITLFKLEWLKPIYKYWMKAAHFIGTVITTILLSVLFYLVFGTAGIILRLLGKDLLDQKIDKNEDSYWIKRNIEFNKEHYKRQF